MCVLSHLLPTAVPFVPGYKKNKSQATAWKKILLEVLRHTADNAYWRWSLRRRHFRVVERVELKIDGMYQVQDSLHHRKYIKFPRYVHQEESAADRQSDERSVPDDNCRVLFCTRYQYLVWLYPSNPSRGVSTNCHSPLPNYTASHWKTVISVLITLRCFTPTDLTPTPAPTKSRSVGIASAIVVLSLTNSRSVISNCLSNSFASTFCCSTAVRTGLLNASVSLSRNSASLRTSSNLPSDMAALLPLLRG